MANEGNRRSREPRYSVMNTKRRISTSGQSCDMLKKDKETRRLRKTIGFERY